MGIAYGFFDCTATIERLREGLGRVVEDPNLEGLKFSLQETADFKRTCSDSDLLELMEVISHPVRPESFKGVYLKPYFIRDLQYTLEARWPGVQPKLAADEIAEVLNTIYLTFESEKPFRGDVFYRENGKYVHRN